MAQLFRMATFCLLLLVGQAIARSQQAETPPPANDAPLPDIATLMHDVEEHERASEEIKTRYIYRAHAVDEETDGSGKVKKTEVTLSEISYQNGTPITRILEKDGKPLNEKETKKQDESVAKQIEKAKDHQQKREEDAITVSRILELGSFSNPRREIYKGRPTIVVDYLGDPKAHTRTRIEELFKRLAGTLWIDEQMRSLVRGDGHFIESFKIGGGLLVNVQKGLHFSFEKSLIHNEVWLPERLEGEGSIRVLLFVHMQGREHITFSDYRRFSSTSTILPANQQIPPDSTAPASESSAPHF